MSVATDIIKSSLDMASFMVDGYLKDLSDADLFIRPAPKANHIAWQLGHLISSEHSLTEAVCPGSMPELPEGFAARHTKETAASDDRDQFDTKDVYLKLMAEQRQGTLAALNSVSDEDLSREAPESVRQMCPTVGATFALQASHWIMHSGQWVIVRRQLGRDPLF